VLNATGRYLLYPNARTVVCLTCHGTEAVSSLYHSTIIPEWFYQIRAYDSYRAFTMFSFSHGVMVASPTMQTFIDGLLYSTFCHY